MVMWNITLVHESLVLFLKYMNSAINDNVFNCKQNHFKILHFEDGIMIIPLWNEDSL